jgi:outer membrane immunogenic protein
MRKTVFAAAAAFAVASGATAFQAAAADLDFMPPPPAPVFHDWTGFYVGGHVGYGEADFTARATVYDPNGGIQFNEGRTLDPSGIVGGVHGGYNWQAGSFVLGIEGDISFTDWDDSTGGAVDVAGVGEVALRAKSEVDFLASVRGRVGMAFDTLLLYGTGGIAFTDASTRFRATVDGDTVLSRKFDFDDIGWVVGGGAEWAAIPNVFSVGVEGLYYIFEDRETRFFDVDLDGVDPGTEVRLTSKFHDAWVIRARANFHF